MCRCDGSRWCARTPGSTGAGSSSRGTRYAGFREPTWADVLAREVEPWEDERLVLDAVRPLEQLVADALAYLVRPPE